MNANPTYGCLNLEHMKAKRLYTILLVTLLVPVAIIKAQTKNEIVDYSLNTDIIAGSGKYAPFLSTANRYDRYGISANSINFRGDIHKYLRDFSDFDYGYGLEAIANLSGSENRFFPGELYVEGKAYFLRFSAGMKHEVYGNQDPELSSGGMIWSSNSRPVPKISISTDDYVPVPLTKNFIKVKGGISHGWFTDSASTKHTLLHHKYAYIKFGGNLPVNLSYGLQHVCQWAGDSKYYGKSPATFDNFKRIFMGESGDSNSPATERFNALGNHIISQSLGLDINLKPAVVSFYWQDISEDPPVFLFKMNKAYNVEDGLWGMSVRMKEFRPLSAFVLEYMSSTDQSGPWHDLDGVIYGGTDNYYNNGVYPNGWSFYGMTMGNPWLTSPVYNDNGRIDIINNKVRLYYFSGKGSINRFSYKGTLAYSENYGSPSVVYEDCRRQLSYQFEVSACLPNLKNTRLSLGFSGDHGKMYGNNSAVLISFCHYGQLLY